MRLQPKIFDTICDHLEEHYNEQIVFSSLGSLQLLRETVNNKLTVEVVLKRHNTDWACGIGYEINLAVPLYESVVLDHAKEIIYNILDCYVDLCKNYCETDAAAITSVTEVVTDANV